MKNKCLFIFIIPLLICFSSTMALAAVPTSKQEAVGMANEELGRIYFSPTNNNGKPLEWLLSKRLSSVIIGSSGGGYGVLVYGAPHGNVKNGESRYVGYTKNDEDYTNPDFPHDAWYGGYLEDRKWVEAPWDRHIPGQDKNDFDGKVKYLPNIQKGIALYYADISRGGDSPYWSNWHKYVHILVPPTEYTWGMGRAWHREADGSVWYISIPLTPGALTRPPDLSTTLEAEKFSGVSPGQKVTSRVTYRLNHDHNRQEKVWLRLHHVVGQKEYPISLEPVNPADVPDADGYVIFKPGEAKTYGYTFTVQPAATGILSRINPALGTDQDKDWSNNRDEAIVIPTAYDVRVEIIPEENTFWTIDGDRITVSYNVRVTRKDKIPGVVNTVWVVRDPAGRHVEEISAGQGHEEMPYDFMAGPGTYTIEAQVSLVGAEDIYPGDNRDSTTVTVVNEILPADRRIHTEIIDGGPTYR